MVVEAEEQEQEVLQLIVDDAEAALSTDRVPATCQICKWLVVVQVSRKRVPDHFVETVAYRIRTTA